MELSSFRQYIRQLPTTEPFPILFFGHGSPMNAIEQNEFTEGWKESIRNLPKPAAILCVSAHWETLGTQVTAMEKPVTIHDFGGFPKALFEVQYPASGSPELVEEVQALITQTTVMPDEKWGLDHGAWSVIRNLYPKADIPVVQLSLDYTRSPQYHYELAKELSALRRRGILVIGSGNIVHNLSLLDWQHTNGGYDWAEEANTKFRDLIVRDEHATLINYRSLGQAFRLAVPTPEHYLPLLYTLSMKNEEEKIRLFNDKLLMGSISMLSLKIGKD